VADALQKKYFGIERVSGTRTTWGKVNDLLALPLDKKLAFCQELYDLSDHELSDFKEVFAACDALGNSKESEEHFKEFIGIKALKKYREIDDFDTLLVLHQNHRDDILELVILNDFDDRAFISKNFRFTPSISRGGCNQSVGDGHVTLKIK